MPASKSMRANINHLLHALSKTEGWVAISQEVALKAVRGIRQHYRRDWSPPAAVTPRRYHAEGS